MPIFKAPNNDTCLAETAPEGWVEITQSELAAIQESRRVLPEPPSPPEQIATLEREQLMPRATREFMLLFMETNFTPVQLAANPGYQAVKAFDNIIVGLRAQL